MHRDMVHIRLGNYISKLQLAPIEIEDGYYRFLIQLKIDTKKDLITIKHSSFNKYLAEAQEQLEKEEVKIRWRDIFIPHPTEFFKLLYVAMWTVIITLVARNIFYG